MFYVTDENGNAIPIAGTGANPNLDCLKTEIVYDMSSSDANKNWGYTSGIMGGVSVSSKNFSKYSSLIIKVTFGNMLGQYVIDLNKLTVDGSAYDGSLKCTTESVANTNEFYSISKVTSDKTTFYHIATGYTSGTTLGQMNNNSQYYVYKIEGILKTPAMIYTGEELFEGANVNINNGTISVRQLVADITFGSASSFEITDLDLQGDGGVYDIIIEPPLTSVQSNFRFRLNNNSSASAYVHSHFDIDPQNKTLIIGSQSSGDGWAYLGAYGPNPNSVFMTLMSSQGRAIWTIDTVGYLGRLDFQKFFGYTVTANVTSMQILANSTLSAGLKVKIYRRLS